MTAYIPIEYILLGAAILLLLSIIASKASGRLGVPSLLLFLIVGMLAGSDGPGGIHFDDPYLTQLIGVVALAFILFAGGLDTNWESIRPVLWQGIALSTAGVLFTAVSVGWFAASILDFTLLEGLLLGAIISSTDAAAVFSILRSRKVSLKRPLKPLLELESGSNDPMAVLLTIGFISLLTRQDSSFSGLLPMMVLQMALGAALGYIMGRGMTALINTIKLEYDGLYPVLSLSFVLLTYGLTASLKGNGFLAVYIAGLVMGNRKFIHKRSLLRFHDGLAWLMQITMFLTLGLLVFPSRLVHVISAGLLVSIFLMLAARPLGVFLTLLPFRTGFREKIMVSWVGLRGAVPIILATFPLLAGIPKADMIFNIVFFIVLTSALFQGTTIPWFARKLGLDAPLPVIPTAPIECEPTGKMRCDLTEVKVPRTSAVADKQLVDIKLPEGALIVLIGRDGEFFVPGGGTTIKPGDRLLLLADRDVLAKVRALLEAEGSA
ncbi:MAG: potassium/proton antiporter [Alphaproteobacteria bacterium]|uniref:Potassium/proton antiporter n=1 Tax=Candidatus Nitrobium versatile TaxID=2884831 RepID=A0A953M325_9BACT|nr:potassium/proton antiporter [Candidatus Nitrobium versatile]